VHAIRYGLEFGTIKFYRSPRKRGYHVNIRLHREFPPEGHYFIRLLLGDDQQRLDYDLPYLNDILYTCRDVDGKFVYRERMTLDDVFEVVLNMEDATQRLQGLKEIVETYEKVGRGDCRNCGKAKELICELEDKIG
jgi:hypothetical protein